MKTIEVKGTERKELGKKATRELRKEEKVPCVIYGGENVVHFSAGINEFRKLVYTPNVYIVGLDVDGKKFTTIMKDITFHPVTDAILHIDFLEISDEKPVVISIPVALNGLAAGVKEGGKLILNSRTLKAKGLSKDFPDTLNVEVTALTLGRSIKVGELSFDNLELLDSKNAVVCAVKLTRSAMSAKGDGVEGEAAEGEAAAE